MSPDTWLHCRHRRLAYCQDSANHGSDAAAGGVWTEKVASFEADAMWDPAALYVIDMFKSDLRLYASEAALRLREALSLGFLPRSLKSPRGILKLFLLALRPARDSGTAWRHMGDSESLFLCHGGLMPLLSDASVMLHRSALRLISLTGLVLRSVSELGLNF